MRQRLIVIAVMTGCLAMGMLAQSILDPDPKQALAILAGGAAFAAITEGVSRSIDKKPGSR